MTESRGTAAENANAEGVPDGAGTTRPRLLVVAPSAYPLGGVATWLDGLVPGLRKNGWNVQVALLAGDHHDVGRYLERHPLGKVSRVANPGGSAAGRRRALARTILASGADLVLSVNVGDIEDALDQVRRRGAAKVRLITTQHGLQRDFYDHLRSRADLIDGVVVTNRLGVELATDYAGLERKRVAYAPYGVELELAPAPRRESAALRIAWVGRLDQAQKRVADLVGIAAHLTEKGVDFRLLVAGGGPERERFEEQMTAAGLAPRAELLGEVPPDQVRSRVYDRSDALIVTSSWETGPIVAWEALAAGLAVASSRYLGSGREAALRDGETALLFDVGDASGAAEQVARLRDPALRKRLVEAGRAEVRTRYSMAASHSAWDAALLRLSRQPARPPRRVPSTPPTSGRLDRWLGAEVAQTLREQLRIRHDQPSAGAEWPHVLCSQGDGSEFFRRAAALDRVAVPGLPGTRP